MTVRTTLLAVCLVVVGWSGSALADGTGSTVPGGSPTTTAVASSPPVATTTTAVASAGGPVPSVTPTTAVGSAPPAPSTSVVRVDVPVVPGGGGSPVVVPVRECAGAVVMVVLNGLPTGPLQGPQLTVPSSGSTTQTFTDVPAGSYTVTIEVIVPGVCKTSTTVAQGSQGPVTTSGGSGSTTPEVASQAPAVSVPSAAARGPAPAATAQSGPLPFTGSSVTGIIQAALLLMLAGQLIVGGSRARRARPSRPKP